MKNYGNATKFISCIVIFTVYSCSPIYRFNRLVKCHPYLLDRIESDTVIVDSGKSIDTFFISKTEFDTFYFDRGVRIDRFRDTFRIYYRERNCTTFIEKTEIRPTTKIVERQIRQEIESDRNKEMVRLSLYVILGLFLIGAIRYIFSGLGK